ncbi:MAG: hypothetical protein KF808_03695 [Cryobacterium sp.]|nr:hypothetical protein [Cryobacterium sp.]
MRVNLVVEGQSDTEAAKAVVRAAGHETGKVVPKGGVTRLDPDIHKYNIAASFEPWVVFRDTDGRCPVELRSDLLAGMPTLASNFHLRLADSMTESWLLADRAGFAGYFGVSAARVSADPDRLPHAKQEVLRLCANSSKRNIRTGMVASDGDVGPEYVVYLNDFAQNHWDVVAAVANSDSLRRAVRRLQQMDASDG